MTLEFNATRLKDARLLRGLSQIELADLLLKVTLLLKCQRC